MIGKTIGNLRITSEIGKGGMGTVYLAEHVRLRKKFAIKSLSSVLTQNPQFRERFHQEAQNQAQL
jgi:eukaryotic-like serine/threonine-protein kinase